MTTDSQILRPILRHRETFTSYPSRASFAAFASHVIDLWVAGRIDDLDFRQRLASLAFCRVDEDVIES